MPATKLYVGNIPNNYDKLELESIFRKYGNVIEFDILKDYGFVHYDQESEARSAADALDGQIHRGSNLRVEVSRSQVRQKPGMGGKGECYRCGGEGHWSKECPRGPTRGRGGGRNNRDNPREMRNGGGGDRFNRGGGAGAGGAGGFGRDPYYSDPYDYYASRRPPPPHPYERYGRFDPYERRMPTMPPRDYYDYPRETPEYYRRSPPPRDPYYDYYMKRRYTDTVDRYGDGPDRPSLGGSSGPGASGADMDIKPPLMRNPVHSGRVPGPY